MTHFTRMVLLFMAAHFSHHVVTALVMPLLPFMRSDLDLSYTQTGLILSAFSLSYGISQIPSGWIADRIGPVPVLTIGIAGVGVTGILIGLSPNYFILLGFLVLMGIAGGGYHPAASPLLTAAVKPENRGKVLGFHVIGGSASHFAAPLLGAAAAARFGWRGAFLILAVPVVLLGLYFPLFYKKRFTAAVSGSILAQTGGDSENMPGNTYGGKEGVNKRLIFELAVFILLVTATGSVLSSTAAFIPLYMVDSFQVTKAVAAAFLALFYSGGMWSAPVGGYLADKYGRKRIISLVAILTAAGVTAIPHLPYGIGYGALVFALGALLFFRMPGAEAHIIRPHTNPSSFHCVRHRLFAGMEGSGNLSPLIGAVIDTKGFTAAFIRWASGWGSYP